MPPSVESTSDLGVARHKLLLLRLAALPCATTSCAVRLKLFLRRQRRARIHDAAVTCFLFPTVTDCCFNAVLISLAGEILKQILHELLGGNASATSSRPEHGAFNLVSCLGRLHSTSGR